MTTGTERKRTVRTAEQTIAYRASMANKSLDSLVAPVFGYGGTEPLAFIDDAKSKLHEMLAFLQVDEDNVGGDS